MADLKPFEVIMRLYPIAGQNDKGEVCMKAERVSELIRCKDCVSYGEMLTGRDTWMICHKFALNFPRDFYCADAERRTDEQTVSE